MTGAAPAHHISVVIPTYRRRDALARTLDALDRQSVAASEFEVVVVDDPVEDDAAAVAAVVGADRRPYAARQVSRHARGVSAARNAGWRAARAPLVLFLGDDIIAESDLLAQHLRCHAEHPGELVGVLGHVRWHHELDVTPFMRWLEHGIQFNYPSITGAEAHWGHFYTANISLGRAALELVGGFDEERFPFLYEDLDLGERLFAQGFRLLYEPRARAEHWHQSAIEDWRGRMAATARAERAWVTLHPELAPYFHDLMAGAARRPPYRGRTTGLLRWVPRGTPWLGPRLWRKADVYFRQQLAPAFLAAWSETEDPRAVSNASDPGAG